MWNIASRAQHAVRSSRRMRNCRSSGRVPHCHADFFAPDLEQSLLPSPAEVAADPARQSTTSSPNPDGELTCPVCWLRFDTGDIMHIAVHDSLRGDPVLGEDAQQRFLATRFNNAGQALDAMGIPSSEVACPHCRRKLPPSFFSAWRITSFRSSAIRAPGSLTS